MGSIYGKHTMNGHEKRRICEVKENEESKLQISANNTKLRQIQSKHSYIR